MTEPAPSEETTETPPVTETVEEKVAETQEKLEGAKETGDPQAVDDLRALLQEYRDELKSLKAKPVEKAKVPAPEKKVEPKPETKEESPKVEEPPKKSEGYGSRRWFGARHGS
jgi:hypothetical protein